MADKIPLVITSGQERQLALADAIAVNNVKSFDDRGYPMDLSWVGSTTGEAWTDTLLDRSSSALSCVGTTLTYTLTTFDGHGRFDFGGVIYPTIIASVSVALVAGTNAAPQVNYVNFQVVGGVPTLLASLTPQILPGCIGVAVFLVGTVSGGTYTIYSYSRARYETNSLFRHVIQRLETQGMLYESGLVPTVGVSTLSISASGAFYNGIFRMTSDNAVTQALFYYIKNGVFSSGTTLAELQFYSDGTAFKANEKGNIVWGVVPTTTTADATLPTVVKLFAILPTKNANSYKSITEARQDLYETVNYYPPNDALKLTFIPIARTIIDQHDTNHFQTFDTGLYFKDLRGKITSGGGAASPTDISGLVPYTGATDNVTLGAYDLSLRAITASSLTSTRIPYAGAAGLLGDSANLVFDGTYLTVASIKDTALTSGRVTFAGAAGLLSDAAALTFDGTLLSSTKIYATTSLGVGVTAPTLGISVKGTAATDAATMTEQLAVTGWTSVDWTGGWVAGWTHTTGNVTVLSQSQIAIPDAYYIVTYTVTNRTAGTFDVIFGGVGVTGVSATGSYVLKALSYGTLFITPTSLFDGTIVISVKKATAISVAIFSALSSDGNSALDFRAITGGTNVYIGKESGAYAVSGGYNVGIGYKTLYTNLTGAYNLAIGSQSMLYTTTGSNNTAFGGQALAYNTTGDNNIAIGATAALHITTGANNIAIGKTALATGTAISTCIALGYYAGVYETASNKLFIDGVFRASEALGRSASLIYGVFAAAAVDQILTINGRVGISLPPTAWLTLPAGTATAGTAPIKMTSGVSTTNAIAGQIEFTTDDFYATISTGPARKGIILNDGSNLTSGKIPIASTNGRLIDGQTPLAGTKTYYVSDSSGGTVNRKLTFISGILTAET